MSKSIFFLFFLQFITLCNIAIAGHENYPIGGRQAGMGFTGVAFADAWSATHNQAGLALLDKPTLGIFYENRFVMKELGLKAGVFALPTKSGTFAINLMQFGYSKYNESKIGIAYAKSLGKRFSLGIQIDYLNTFFSEEYGNKGTAIAELGFLAQPIDNLFIGAHIYNISRSKIAAYNNERVPTLLTVGMAYKFSEKVLCSVEAEKDFDYKAIFKVGMEYQFIENVFVRAGVTSNPNQMCIGIGYILKRFKADVSFSTHQVLGVSPHVGFTYTFK
jgi:hypothetical protein